MKHAKSKLMDLRSFRYESCRMFVYGPTHWENILATHGQPFETVYVK